VGGGQVNELGVIADAPHAKFWVDRGHPTRPPAFVTTNQLGFRDRDFAQPPAAGVTRAVMIGDSYVYGMGVPEADGLINRQLEKALRAAAPGRQLEVVSVAYPGWGYFTYFDVARRALRQLRPRVIVVGSLGSADWDLFDFQQQADILGPRLFALLGALGVAEDLKAASVRYWGEAVSDDAAFTSATGAPRLRRLVADLLEEAARLECDVVVWEYYQPFAFLQEFAGRPRFHLAGWPPGFDRRLEGWGRDARLSIPGDWHPTAAGNALVAQHLAPVILGLLGGAPASAAGPASAASAPAPASSPALRGPTVE
jgi:hypothetical protein